MTLCNVTVVCCCCIPPRAGRCEPARRGVCERQTPPGRGEAADSGAGPSGRPAMRHLPTAAGEPRLRQQDPRQVNSAVSGSMLLAKYLQNLALFLMTRSFNLISTPFNLR